jgi:hypothetical protein
VFCVLVCSLCSSLASSRLRSPMIWPRTGGRSDSKLPTSKCSALYHHSHVFVWLLSTVSLTSFSSRATRFWLTCRTRLLCCAASAADCLRARNYGRVARHSLGLRCAGGMAGMDGMTRRQGSQPALIGADSAGGVSQHRLHRTQTVASSHPLRHKASSSARTCSLSLACSCLLSHLITLIAQLSQCVHPRAHLLLCTQASNVP